MPKSSSGRIGSSSCRQTGPESRPGGEAHDRDARDQVAGHDRPLDRGRAAPARQQRRVHVEDLVGAQERLAHEHAVGADAQRVGLGGGDAGQHVRVVQRLGLDHLEAERPRRAPPRAAAAARGRGRAGRSGRVTTSAGRCGPAARARAPRRRTPRSRGRRSAPSSAPPARRSCARPRRERAAATSRGGAGRPGRCRAGCAWPACARRASCGRG